jgi:hypothetical protein
MPCGREVVDCYREAFGNRPLRFAREVLKIKWAGHIFTLGVPNEGAGAVGPISISCSLGY